MEKKQTELNPKLKEIYERVMNTKISSSAPAPKPTQSQSDTKQSPPQLTSIAVNAPPSPIKSSIKKQAKNPSRIILIITGVIFFLAYALFWTRFFNLKLPFSLPF